MNRSAFDPGNPTGAPLTLGDLLAMQNVGAAPSSDLNNPDGDPTTDAMASAMGTGGGGGGGLPFLPSHSIASDIAGTPAVNQAAVTAASAAAPSATSGFNLSNFLGLNTPGLGAALGLGVLGSLLAPKPFRPTSFSTAKGTQGEMVNPINALYNALNGTDTLGTAISNHLKSGVSLPSSFVQKGPSPVQIPGLNFQIGGGLATDPAALDKSLLTLQNPDTTYIPSGGSTASGNVGAIPRKRVG